MNDQELAVAKFRDTFGNKLWRLSHLYKIKTKGQKLELFRPNSIQRRIFEKIMPDYNSGLAVTHFDQKYRQGGVSTAWLIWHLDETIFNRNTNTGVLADLRENLGYLFEIVRLAHAEMPERIRPRLGDDSKSVLSFPDLNSKIFVSLGIKATTLHGLHISEYAYCDPIEIARSMGGCTPNANVSMETTANGINHGEKKYKEMKSIGKALFHCWPIQEEYRDDPLGVEVEPNQEENELSNRLERDYGVRLDAGQILYRRRKKRELKGLFPQEMAEDDVTCFLTSGNSFFDNLKIQTLRQEADEYAANNKPVKEETTYDDEGSIVPTLTQWEYPEKGCVYAAGADVAEGKNDGGNRDYSVLAIFNVTKRRQAFRYRARVAPDYFFKVCDQWGRYYNNALLGVERNNHGHAVILGLTQISHYPNLFVQKDDTRLIIKSGQQQKSIWSHFGDENGHIGWLTTSNTKPLILDQIRQAIQGEFEADEKNFQPEFTILDQLFLDEALSVKEEEGKIEAMQGKHDDLVMAWAIAYQMYRIQRGRGDGPQFLIGSMRDAS